MILNIIWLIFFFGAFVACMVQWLAFGDTGIFNKAIMGAFDMSKTAFEIAMPHRHPFALARYLENR